MGRGDFRAVLSQTLGVLAGGRVLVELGALLSLVRLRGREVQGSVSSILERVSFLASPGIKSPHLLVLVNSC